MALPTPNFPASIWDGNEQDITNDGPPDPLFEQAGDDNEMAAEVIAIQNYIRTKKSIQAINKSGGNFAKDLPVSIDGFDATSGLLTIVKADRGVINTWAAGFLPAAINDDAEGEVILYGLMTFDTTGLTTGNYLWLGAVGAVSETPNDLEGEFNQRLARILVGASATGKILVEPDSGFTQTQSEFTRIGTLAASDDRWIFYARHRVRVHGLVILSDTATAGSTGANNYSFQVRNHTDGNDLLSTPQTTQTGELVVNGRLRIAFDQNQNVAAARALELQITKNGAPTDLSTAELAAIIYYTPIPA